MIAKKEICSHNLCTGCAACMNSCPKDAIIMYEDKLGFMHPHINKDKCIDCGVCERVCPVINPIELNKPNKVYAVVSNDNIERKTSSSGGAASVIARWIIQQGGVVYGCSQDNYKTIHHIRVDKEDNIHLLKGSKYVQSNINYILRSVKKDLLDNKKVFFVGTPCQIAGLKRYLKKDYETLFTADLICHGVPSQRMLRENIELNWCFKQDLANKSFVNFRWKANYGIQFGIQFGIQDEKNNYKILSTKSLPHDPYIMAFFTGVSFRENCHTCPYSTHTRVGDITIGDFWKLGSLSPTKLYIKDGVSLLLINTEKGHSLIKTLQDRFIIEERLLQEAILGNDNLRKPTPRPPYKDRFMALYENVGLENACKKAIPKKIFYKLALIEYIKKNHFIVYSFKKIRLLLNTISK